MLGTHKPVYDILMIVLKEAAEILRTLSWRMELVALCNRRFRGRRWRGARSGSGRHTKEEA